MRTPILLCLALGLFGCGSSQHWANRDNEGDRTYRANSSSSTHSEEDVPRTTSRRSQTQPLTPEEQELEAARKAFIENLANDEPDPCVGDDCPAPLPQAPTKREEPRMSVAEQQYAEARLRASLADDYQPNPQEVARAREELERLSLPAVALESAPARVSRCIQLAEDMANSMKIVVDMTKEGMDCKDLADSLNQWASSNGLTLLNADDEGAALGLSELELQERRVMDVQWKYRDLIRDYSRNPPLINCPNVSITTSTVAIFQRLPYDFNSWTQPREQAEALVEAARALSYLRNINNQQIEIRSCGELGDRIYAWANEDAQDLIRIAASLENDPYRLFSVQSQSVTRNAANSIDQAYREEYTRFVRNLKKCSKNADFAQRSGNVLKSLRIPDHLAPVTNNL